MNLHETAIRNECERRNIAVSKQGNGWKLQGAGVDLVTASWKHVRAEDLQPPKTRKGEWQWW